MQEKVGNTSVALGQVDKNVARKKLFSIVQLYSIVLYYINYFYCKLLFSFLNVC